MIDKQCCKFLLGIEENQSGLFKLGSEDLLCIYGELAWKPALKNILLRKKIIQHIELVKYTNTSYFIPRFLVGQSLLFISLEARGIEKTQNTELYRS